MKEYLKWVWYLAKATTLLLGLLIVVLLLTPLLFLSVFISFPVILYQRRKKYKTMAKQGIL
jgi:hypothetical protein